MSAEYECVDELQGTSPTATPAVAAATAAPPGTGRGRRRGVAEPPAISPAAGTGNVGKVASAAGPEPHSEPPSKKRRKERYGGEAGTTSAAAVPPLPAAAAEQAGAAAAANGGVSSPRSPPGHAAGCFDVPGNRRASDELMEAVVKVRASAPLRRLCLRHRRHVLAHREQPLACDASSAT